MEELGTIGNIARWHLINPEGSKAHDSSISGPSWKLCEQQIECVDETKEGKQDFKAKSSDDRSCTEDRHACFDDMKGSMLLFENSNLEGQSKRETTVDKNAGET